ncbi:Pr6Pr family membrane protein [Modestobacter sp. Leaf380]|uniref:Pr6Pr family membrane protein n=1 Tax=Modestobacter sp. Leaf380 TaxID=1736356 RepID=UPI0006F31CCD|nr:Pr6Pr family membrane protein [Modestobacter sp. Leaf380]KQS68877.1 hypothetical protein ASG41_08215 [Modestobacter sp. Leaf380]
MTDRRTLARVVHTALAVVVVLSVLTELGRAVSGANVLVPADDPGAGTRVLRFSSYFTIQSNLLVLAAVLPLTRDPDHDGRGWRVLRLTAMLGITVTGLVYVFVLGPDLDPQGLGWWTNAGLHYVAPVLALVSWLLLGPRPRVTGATVGWALVWPLAWIGYALALGALTDWYPYPFLDVTVIGYAAALRNVAFVAVLAVVLLLVFRLADRKLPATAEVSPAAR